MTPLSQQMQYLSSAFAREGYVTLPNVVSKSRLAALTDELRGEYARATLSSSIGGVGVEPDHIVRPRAKRAI
jgi:hypothetical protein